jgi:hypothetical protein
MDPDPLLREAFASFPSPPGRADPSSFIDYDNDHVGHPTFPLTVSEFPEFPQAHRAISNLRLLLEDGFTTEHSLKGPNRELWLRTVLEAISILGNSIAQTQTLSSPSTSSPFLNLSDEEQTAFDLMVESISNLNAYFNSHFLNYSTATLCLCCLSASGLPITEAHFNSVMIACDQNVSAAHATITNELIHDMRITINKWSEDRTNEIQESMIATLIAGPFDRTLLDTDDRVHKWMCTARDSFHDELCHHISNDATASNHDLAEWIKSATQSALTTADEEVALRKAQRLTELNVQLESDFTTYCTTCSTALQQQADTELDAFKHSLRITTEQQKANASKAADAAVRSSTRKPSISTATSKRITRSVSRSNQASKPPTRDSSTERP